MERRKTASKIERLYLEHAIKRHPPQADKKKGEGKSSIEN